MLELTRIGILTAVFYGTFADRVGRKPVLLLAGIGELSVAVWILVICKCSQEL